MTIREQASAGRRPSYAVLLPALCAKLMVLGVAALVVTTTACPLVVGLACLAVLVLITGSALAQLILGESRNRTLLTDPAVRLPLTVVFGTVSLLIVVFALHFSGAHIGTGTVTLGIAGTGGAAVIGQSLRWLPRLGPSPAELVRPLSGATAAAVVIAAAVVAAVALQPKAAESFTTLTFADQAWLSEPAQPAVTAEPVRMNWILRSFGYLPDPGLFSVQVVLDDVPLSVVAVDLGDVVVAAQPSDFSEMKGSVSFLAPNAAGLHRVSISVYPYGRATVAERAPVTLTGWIEVGPRG